MGVRSDPVAGLGAQDVGQVEPPKVALWLGRRCSRWWGVPALAGLAVWLRWSRSLGPARCYAPFSRT